MKGAEKDNNIIILCSGRSVLDYKKRIERFIKEQNCVTIGINNITHLFVPDYHVWTNARRWRAYSSCIKAESKLLLGPSIKNNMIPSKFKKNVTRIEKVDKIGTPLDYKDGVIYGHFRNAGVLSIMIAHIMSAKNIFVVGMDGHTKNDIKDLKAGKESQHCYGEGYTDGKSWANCIKADGLGNDNLHSLREYGISFTILTPTIHEEFYDGTLLGIENEN